jgi:3-hydroxyacyl-[acyl-carrier-protein] dehydratase
MPGVLILEAMAQATGLLGFNTMEDGSSDKMLYLFVGVDEARFKRQVIPGDTMTLHVEFLRKSRGIWKFNCTAKVGDELAAEAIIMCAARDKPE